MEPRVLSIGSLAIGLLSLLWFVFFLAQALMPMPVHLPDSVRKPVGIPLTFVLPVAAIVLGVVALLQINARGVQVIAFDQIAALTGAILGGVVLLLCLLAVLWLIVLPL